MAVNVSSGLKTLATANSRQIAWQLLVDWADDGFASQATWTDESANIVIIKPQDWDQTSWGYEIGTIHPHGAAESQGMYSTSQRHGYGMWAMNQSSIWLKDSSRAILMEKA